MPNPTPPAVDVAEGRRLLADLDAAFLAVKEEHLRNPMGMEWLDASNAWSALIRKKMEWFSLHGPALLDRIDELEEVCGEGYQVVGVLAERCGLFDDPAVQKALDNLSDNALTHSDVLPLNLPDTAAEQVASLRGALQKAPLPSMSGNAAEFYQRFFDWLKNDVEPALERSALGAAP